MFIPISQMRRLRASEMECSSFHNQRQSLCSLYLPGQEVKSLEMGMSTCEGQSGSHLAQGQDGGPGVGVAALTHHFLPPMLCCCTV